MPGDAPGPWWKRLGWMVAIWAMSVGLLGIVGWIIRLWIKPD